MKALRRCPGSFFQPFRRSQANLFSCNSRHSPTRPHHREVPQNQVPLAMFAILATVRLHFRGVGEYRLTFHRGRARYHRPGSALILLREKLGTGSPGVLQSDVRDEGFVETPLLPNDCVHLRAGCKERDVSNNRNAGPSSATLCSAATCLRLPLSEFHLQFFFHPLLGEPDVGRMRSTSGHQQVIVLHPLPVVEPQEMKRLWPIPHYINSRRLGHSPTASAHNWAI